MEEAHEENEWMNEWMNTGRTPKTNFRLSAKRTKVNWTYNEEVGG